MCRNYSLRHKLLEKGTLKPDELTLLRSKEEGMRAWTWGQMEKKAGNEKGREGKKNRAPVWFWMEGRRSKKQVIYPRHLLPAKNVSPRPVFSALRYWFLTHWQHARQTWYRYILFLFFLSSSQLFQHFSIIWRTCEFLVLHFSLHVYFCFPLYFVILFLFNFSFALTQK